MELPVPLDDTALAGIDVGDLAAAVARQRQRQRAGAPGRLAVPDQRLLAAARLVDPQDEPIRVTVINSGGAGGLLGLDRRRPDGLVVEAVESAIRDLDDPAGNAARIVAAAEPLADAEAGAIELFVGLPPVRGWSAAAEEVEAAGHAALVIEAAGPTVLIEQLSGLIELDCPFAVRPVAGRSPTAVLAAVLALIEDASMEEAVNVLGVAGDPVFDEVAATRLTRRRVRVGVDLAIG